VSFKEEGKRFRSPFPNALEKEGKEGRRVVIFFKVGEREAERCDDPYYQPVKRRETEGRLLLGGGREKKKGWS